MGVVHSDLKPDNVLVSTDEDEALSLHIIDFGISTLSGHKSPMPPRANWEERLRQRQWYSAEFYRGEALDARSDAPGLAFCMRAMMPYLKEQFPSLQELVGRARALDGKDRPTLKEFYRTLHKEYLHLEERIK